MKKNDCPMSIYKEIIDNLVEDSNSITAKLILNEKLYSRSEDEAIYNDFVSNLNDKQRIILADMMKKERRSAFHDVLASLTWWIDCKEVTLCYEGNEMPVQLSGMGLHGDYIGRLSDWEWPE